MSGAGRSSSYATLSSEDAASEQLELQAAGEDLDALVRSLPLEGALRVLEVGCGTGALARAVARRLGPGAHIHGVDLSPEHIAFARRAGAADPGARDCARMTFEVMDAMMLEAPPAYDLIYCRYVLMYILPRGQGAAFLARMRRLLAPGGRIACIEADINFGQDRYPPPPPELARVLPRIVEHYRRAAEIEWRAGVQLHHCLRRSGLCEVEVKLASARIIQGGSPFALVEHDAAHVEELVAPLVPPAQRSLIAAQWRDYLAREDSFLYTPIFVGVGKARE